MQSGDLCEICGRRKAELSCPKCGRRVCRECFNEEKGICLVCSETICERCGKKHSVERCQICGRLICPDCLVRVDKVRAVCLDCFQELGKEGVYRAIRERIVEERKKLASRLKERYLQRGKGF
ncbi:MAG: hypothetical protein ACPLZ8_02775 [Fervidicoccaceae archaeon]|jgi:hypothetical protein